MTKSIKMEVFRAGKQIDSAGNEREWTESDLDSIVDNFNKTDENGNKLFTVPATIGHPKDDSPAWGWFTKMTRKGKSLFAELGEATDELKTMLDKGMFKNRSIALRGDLSPRHIAFLGAQPPAVKGLEALSFKEKEDLIFGEPLEFTDSDSAFGFRIIKNVFRKLRDRLIEKDGVEKANEIINEFDIEALAEIKETILESNQASSGIETSVGFNENNGGSDMELKDALETIENQKNKIAELEASNSEFSEKLETSHKKVSELQTQIETDRKAAKEKEFSEFAEKLISEKKLFPGNKEAIIKTCVSIDGQEAMTFSEGGKDVKKTPLQHYQESLEKGPVILEDGAQFTEGKNVNKKEEMILQYMEKNNLPEEKYSQALIAVSKILGEN